MHKRSIHDGQPTPGMTAVPLKFLQEKDSAIVANGSSSTLPKQVAYEECKMEIYIYALTEETL